MPSSGLFDDILRAFLAALEAGTLSLGAYSLPLLATFAVIGWYWQFGRELALGGANLGDALAKALLYSINIGIAYWLLINLHPMAVAAYQTFLQWGLTAGGGATAGLLLTPSSVVDMGFTIAAPLWPHLGILSGWTSVLAWPLTLLYISLGLIVVAALSSVALTLMLTVIEFHLAVMVGAVLIPFGVFSPLAFLTEYAIGWITGGLLRVLVTAVIVGTGYPLIGGTVRALGDGAAPTYYNAVIVATVSLLYAWMTWSIPNKASTMCGRVALGLSGSSVASAAMTTARVGMAAHAVASGASSMLQARQQASVPTIKNGP